jgi:hypothetical protein
MGKRRIRLISRISNSIGILGVDARADRCKEVGEQYFIQTLNNLEDAIDVVIMKDTDIGY